MESWAARELRTIKLGDARLTKRLVGMVEAFAAQPVASVPQASGTWAATKAAYRFFDSEQFEPVAIRRAHRDSTVGRVSTQQTVLVAQDTTDLKFTQRLGSGEGSVVMKVHSALCTSLDGVPQGIIHQQVWVREEAERGKTKARRRLDTKDKESQRWLSALSETLQAIPGSIGVITVADREADIYDLFAQERRAGAELLIRAAQDRKVSPDADSEVSYLWTTIEGAEVAGTTDVEVHRREGTPARTARLTVRHTRLEIQPPRHHKGRSRLKPIGLWAVLAREEEPSPGIDPVRWLLLTTLPIECLAQAVQCLRWYSYRWLIERYHYVLKSGCTLESLQLETEDRLERALATYSLVAWRLLWLTYEARRTPDAPCDQVLAMHEWQALYCTVHQTPLPPAVAPTLQESVRWVARLGGFLARKGDGEPGVKTIWRGLTRLHDIANTWLLLHPNPLTNPQPLSTYG